ncbi:putative flippase GtrA [Paenibacillus taihuensis]|uniref:Putative flippase GtrA n=1 Tax=Paenibacillus taihuensis TaxID=1156355 RepID=A0A3D9SCK8_9BACL|nr:GtrA family protein [Paenibacillus taihuensis]REE91621.1 putative flippase GtrA [Paenibacillus taihuensis]
MMIKNPRGLLEKPFIRYLIIGVFNTLIGLSVTYGTLHLLAFSYWGSTFTGNSVGAIVSYTLNRKFTFNNRGRIFRTFLLFVLAILFCYVSSYYIGLKLVQLAGMMQFMHLSSNAAKDIAVIISTGLYTVMNYFGQKLIVFRETENRYEASN